MNNLYFSHIRKNIAILLSIWGMASCGQMAPEFLASPPDSPPVIRLASDSIKERVRVVPQSYLVMFKTTNIKSNLFFSTFADEFAHHYADLNSEFESDSRIKNIDILTSVDMKSERDTEWEPEFSIPKVIDQLGQRLDESAEDAGVLARVDFDTDDSSVEVLREWEREGRIWYAEPNEISYSDAGELEQYHQVYQNIDDWHKTIKLPEAFNALATAKDPAQSNEQEILANRPVVAVLDSGVDYEHPKLADNIWVNTAVGSAGCVDDLHGCNTTAPSKGSLGNGEVWPVVATGPNMACATGGGQSKCDHGTHVAGIVASDPSESDNVGGVCPFCQIMILRVGKVAEGDTSGEPSIQDDSQLRAFKYLTRFRKSGGSAVRIVNASFGKYTRSRSLAILVDVLKKVGSGTLVIAAASNEDAMVRAYPAAFSSAVAVSSIHPTRLQKSAFSNYGPWVDIAAPGDEINSTLSGGSYGSRSGTSMAAPVVAGAVGLLIAAYPNLGFNEIRNRLLNSANASLLYGDSTDGAILNRTYYYAKVKGETARRPLLGGGILDVEALVSGKQTTATGQPLERVTAGCGVVDGSGSGGFGTLLFALGLPVLLSISRRCARVLIRRRGLYG